MISRLIAFKKQLDDQLVALKAATAPYAGKSPVIAEKMADIEKLYKEKIETTKPQIMVFGIYNAGKSSILNELLREDRAKCNDVPTTDKVDYYNWMGYSIADTPGVGAPIEHEKVTNEAIRKADVVLFVMSNKSGYELKQNYVRMKDIIDAGKKVIVVINDKEDMIAKHNDEAIFQIRQKVYENMTALGIEDVERNFDVVFVNARMAHKGRTEEKQKLWELSGISALEKEIATEMKKSSDFKVLRNAIYEINRDVDDMQKQISAVNTAPEYQALQKVLHRLHEAKVDVRKNMSGFITSQTNRWGDSMPDAIWAVHEDQQKVDQTVQEAQQELIAKVQVHLEDQIRTVLDDLLLDWREFIVELNKMEHVSENHIHVESLDVPSAGTDAMRELQNDGNLLKDGIEAWEKSKIEAEGYRTIAKEGTQLIEGMMKDMGVKLGKGGLMGYLKKKLGLGTVIKTIPIPFPPIEIILGGYTVLKMLFGDDGSYERERAAAARENAIAKAKAEAEGQARQALQQKCGYMADEIKENLMLWTNQVIREQIGRYEDNLTEKMDALMDSQHNYTILADALRRISDSYDKLSYDMK